MAITAQEENCFSIRGLDQAWAGEGMVEGQHGRYCWRFADGRTGQTLFAINPDGTLTGHVVGSGLDWWYLARRSLHDREQSGADLARRPRPDREQPGGDRARRLPRPPAPRRRGLRPL